MKPPIVINDSKKLDVAGDVGVYESVELAERALEHHDAEDEQIHIVDSEGRLLKIVLDGQQSFHLENAEETPSQRDALRRMLRDHLIAVKRSPERVLVMTLGELLQAAYEYDPNPYS